MIDNDPFHENFVLISSKNDIEILDFKINYK